MLEPRVECADARLVTVDKLSVEPHDHRTRVSPRTYGDCTSSTPITRMIGSPARATSRTLVDGPPTAVT